MALATTVRLAKVHTVCKNFGYSDQIGSYLKCGVDCLMIYNTQQTYHEHPNREAATMINRCWNTRRDETGLTSSPTIKIVRKAA
jgi:hypothetical protein